MGEPSMRLQTEDEQVDSNSFFSDTDHKPEHLCFAEAVNPAFWATVFTGTLVPLRPTTLRNFNSAMSEHDI